MADFIIMAVLVVIIGAAIFYIVKSKKSGVKCIGCPAGGACSHKCSEASGCGCGCSGESKSDCGCHAETK